MASFDNRCYCTVPHAHAVFVRLGRVTRDPSRRLDDLG